LTGGGEPPNQLAPLLQLPLLELVQVLKDWACALGAMKESIAALQIVQQANINARRPEYLPRLIPILFPANIFISPPNRSRFECDCNRQDAFAKGLHGSSNLSAGKTANNQLSAKAETNGL